MFLNYLIFKIIILIQIESLQEESRNLNFRVSQLYIQLLEEIINKKDETIRYTELQNQLLNETVRHYQLRVKNSEYLLFKFNTLDIVGSLFDYVAFRALTQPQNLLNYNILSNCQNCI